MNSETLVSPVAQEDDILDIDEILENLTNLGLIDSAKQISVLFNLKEDELETGMKLPIESVIEYYKFSKNNFFEVEPGMGLTQEGDLIADWSLANKNNVCINFLKNKNLEFVIKTENSSISSTTTNRDIIQILTKSNVNKC